MKTVIVYGAEHKGSTYNVVQLFKKQLSIADSDITEFFLPKDLPHFCCGCNNCFMKGEEQCPHQHYVSPIKEAMRNAELIILASPVYVFHVTGQMKAFLDHYAFQTLAHRPDASMFSKTALIVSIGAGGGMSTTIKDMQWSLKYWGISRIFSYGCAIHALSLDDMTKKEKSKMERNIVRISKKINAIRKSKSSLSMKLLFSIFRMMQQKYGYIPYDKTYWSQQGWLDKNRPWKN